MDIEKFRNEGYKIVDWIADYFSEIKKYPVKSPAQPREILEKLPESAPSFSEDFDDILKDFNELIMPGITHWQHPNFHAYFPANNSFPSILAEFLTSALGAQCMIWQTSPAAAELEEKMMEWLRALIGLPESFTGVIQDTASSATLVSILTAREKYSAMSVNNEGFNGREKFRVYCSVEAHSSIDKAVKIAGIGLENLVKIPVGANFAMIPGELEKAIEKDIAGGYSPLCIVSALGTTGSTAVDPLEEISRLARKYKIWHHVDAAFAGSAMILPEKRHFLKGAESADSFVFNPHKWLFTNFDCSAYFVKDKDALIQAFAISPEYLKTAEDDNVNNYRDWGIALGRRFRALKLWFVLRSFGAEGLKQKIREHINIAEYISAKIESQGNFELLAPVNFNTICFRYYRTGAGEEELNRLNESLEKRVNDSGKIFITHTKLNGKYALRLVFGQTNLTKGDAEYAWKIINELSNQL